jgi:D-arabinitol 2-dehydrogenase
MFKSVVLRQVSRPCTTTIRARQSPSLAQHITRSFSNTLAIHKDKDEPDQYDQHSTAGEPGAFEHEGQYSRTDKTIRVEYPEEEDLPRQKPVQGRGGMHFKRTLASFSLEDRVGVVTGGARGLGLVMGQALVVSGADVAIVDLNSTLVRF